MYKGHGQEWTPEHEARLAELYETGESTTRIAERLTREFGQPFTKNRVVGKAGRLGIRHPGATSSQLLAHQRRTQQMAERRAAHDAAIAPLLIKDSARGCLYIPGEPLGLDTEYCGRPRFRQPDGGRSAYCEHHHEICHAKPPPASERRGRVQVLRYGGSIAASAPRST